jgi:hypothetical protein
MPSSPVGPIIFQGHHGGTQGREERPQISDRSSVQCRKMLWGRGLERKSSSGVWGNRV